MSSKKKVASDLPNQKWYRTLPPTFKALYIHLICIANVAGVFEIDIDSFRFHVKDNDITDDDVFYRFGNRVQRIKGHPDKGIIVGYVAFQHTFPKTSEQWKWVDRELAKVGITIDQLDAMRMKEGEQMLLPIDCASDKPKRKPREKQERHTIPPDVEWVREYCSTRNNGVDADAFMSFYESKGWKVGNQHMKDWQAAVRTWEKRDDGKAAAQKSEVKVAASKSPIRKVF